MTVLYVDMLLTKSLISIFLKCIYFKNYIIMIIIISNFKF